MTGLQAQASRRTFSASSALVRLLAALNDDPAPATTPVVEQLSGWFDWTDAIALSAALDCPPAWMPAPGSPGAAPTGADERECRRVRAALVALVAPPAVEPRAAGRPARPAAGVRADDPVDFAPHRERVAAAQQAMETHIAALRRRVRSTLATASPALARLAALDVVMEQVVGARERALLATVPRRLERRFEHLREAREQACEGQPAPSPSGDWRRRFSAELRDVLLAELELRMQPVEGLLDALRGSTPGHHD